MSSLARETRLALRSLRRSPGFTAVAIATLALGIGANTFVFSLIDAALLESLPYPDGDRLVAVSTRYAPDSGQDYPFFALSWPEYRDYRREATQIADIAAYQLVAASLAEGRGEPERLPAVRATENLFDVLQTRPILGRGFAQGEDAPGAPCTAVLSHGVWVRRFGSDPGVLDRPLRLDGVSCAVVGVMPDGFAFPSPDVGLWVALAPAAGDRLLEERGSHGLAAVGRLAPKATLDSARAEAETTRGGWARKYPEHHRGHFVVLRTLRAEIVGEARTGLLVLFAAVVLVLAVVCVNLTNLLLARNEDRRQELAVRTALGAPRSRLFGQLLTEGGLLALGGALAGALVAEALVEAARKTTFLPIPRADEIHLGGRAWAFHIAAAALAGCVLGLASAVGSFSRGTFEILRGTGRRATAGSSTLRLRGVLTVGQIALSALLVLGAALLARTEGALRRAPLGFDPSGVVTAQIDLPEGAYTERPRIQEFFRALDLRLAAMPGVEAVGSISSLPLEEWPPPDAFVIEGRPVAPPGGPVVSAGYYMVTPAALASLEVPVLRGRALRDSDAAGSPLVALVNEAAARQFWPGEDPVGRTIHYYEPDDERPIRIVGVVGDTRYRRVSEPAAPAVYVPHAQSPRERYLGRSMAVVLRTAEPEAAAAAVRQAARELDPTVPVTELREMEDVVAQATGPNRVLSRLIGGFALLVLLLSALGVYGIVAYGVQRRTHELGIRLALGGSPAQIVRGVLAGGARLAAAGVILGLGVAAGLGRAVQSQLYGVRATDPATYAGVGAGLLLIALLSSAFPARRAGRVDPMKALRGE
jgi:putative ABC transport system permease protein